MSVTFPAKKIANYFIQRSRTERDASLDLMKLLKLIYIAHGWSLALFSRPLIQEPVKAWKYGPVIEEIYHKFKYFGVMPIEDLAVDYSLDSNGDILIERYAPEFDEETQALLDKVWSVYQPNSGIELSNWSHSPDGPWYDVWHRQGGKKLGASLIPNEDIKQYFIKIGNVTEEG